MLRIICRRADDGLSQVDEDGYPSRYVGLGANEGTACRARENCRMGLFTKELPKCLD